MTTTVGRQIVLSGERSVWVGSPSPGTYTIVWTRPNDDGTTHETVVSMSREAFEAMLAILVQMIESGELVSTEISLAAPEEEKSPCPEP